MKRWTTIIKAVNPLTGELCEFAGPNIEAPTRAGYSEKTAYSIGSENLRKPEIADYLSERLKERAMKAEEAVKLISDIARSSLNDFFTIRQVEYTPRIVKPLAEIIKECEKEIEFEEEYAAQVSLTAKEAIQHTRSQEARKRGVVRLKLELKKNPNATRIVNGETIFIDHVDLDIVKLVKAKETGRIKSITPGQFGLKVELYAADAALRDIAKINGLLKDQHELTGKDGKPIQIEQITGMRVV